MQKLVAHTLLGNPLTFRENLRHTLPQLDREHVEKRRLEGRRSGRRDGAFGEHEGPQWYVKPRCQPDRRCGSQDVAGDL
jgi:hypothetical protein